MKTKSQDDKYLSFRFIELYKKDLYLMPASLHEKQVQEMFEKAKIVLQRNLFGPKYYIKCYDKYLWLLDGTAEAQLTEFLNAQPNFKVSFDVKHYVSCKRFLWAAVQIFH